MFVSKGLENFSPNREALDGSQNKVGEQFYN
jgi:hypothetical protein